MKLTSKNMLLGLFFIYVDFGSGLAFFDSVTILKANLIQCIEANLFVLFWIFNVCEDGMSVDVLDSLHDETLRMVAGLVDMLKENAHLLIL